MDEKELNDIETNEVEARWHETGNPALGYYGMGPASMEDLRKDCECQGKLWQPGMAPGTGECLPGGLPTGKQWDINKQQCVTEKEKTKLTLGPGPSAPKKPDAPSRSPINVWAWVAGGVGVLLLVSMVSGRRR